MHLLTIILLGISSNLDTLGVGLAYGTRKYRLLFLSNFICALIPCIGTYLMMILGEAVRYIISAPLANLLGAGIIMAAGVVLIIQYFRRPYTANKIPTVMPGQTTGEAAAQPSLFTNMKDLGRILEDPFKADYDYSGSIEFKEATVLAFALTLNNLSCGFAAGLMGLNIFLTVGAAFIISLLFFYAGIQIGLYFIARWIGEKGDLAAGIILILLGIYELLS
ncbi:MAG: manganese efflux pump [Thermacetogeniaceae bacterium]